MEICTLASGSSGNSLLVSQGETHLLLDAGISARRITCALGALGLDPGRLSAVLITHEHSDHISGLPVLAKRTRCPIIASRGTSLELLRRIAFLEDRLRPFQPGESFQLGDVGVETFPTPHDAAESACFAFSAGGRKAAVVTDLGHVTPAVQGGVRGCHLLAVEANHDVGMLTDGPYPPFLKARILGGQGHLSNEAGGLLAAQCAASGARRVILAHLSAQNNTPSLAYAAVRALLERGGAAVGRDVALAVAPRSQPGERYTV